jgi:hypothetical protein
MRKDRSILGGCPTLKGVTLLASVFATRLKPGRRLGSQLKPRLWLLPVMDTEGAKVVEGATSKVSWRGRPLASPPELFSTP